MKQPRSNFENFSLKIWLKCTKFNPGPLAGFQESREKEWEGRKRREARIQGKGNGGRENYHTGTYFFLL